jgi:hypothetical protein
VGPSNRAGRGRRTRDDQPDLYKLAYEEGKRALEDQLAELDTMRQRSVQFLAFVGSASAFLVGTSLKATDRSLAFYILAVTASIATLLTVALCLALLTASRLPRARGVEEWSLNLSPSALIKWIEPDVRPPRESDFYRALAERYDQMTSDNLPGLNRMRHRYVLFLGGAVMQLTLWLALAWAYA